MALKDENIRQKIFEIVSNHTGGYTDNVFTTAEIVSVVSAEIKKRNKSLNIKLGKTISGYNRLIIKSAIRENIRLLESLGDEKR